VLPELAGAVIILRPTLPLTHGQVLIQALSFLIAAPSMETKPMRARDTDVLQYSEEPVAGPAIGIKDLLLALHRGWRFPVFGSIIGLILGLSYMVSIPPLYKSNAQIVLDRSMNRYLQTNKVVDEPTFDQAELESQIHILLSESIIIPVVRSMDLVHDTEFVGPPNGFGAQSLLSSGKIIRMLKQSIGLTDEAQSKIDSDSLPERIAVEAFMKRLSVAREDVANVINVTFAAEDPRKAADIANAIADAYLATRLESKSESTKIASQWLQDRLMKLRVQAIEADRTLQNYKIANNLVTTDKASPNSEQLTALKTQLANARMAVADVKARLERIQQTLNDGNLSATVPDALNNAVIVRLRGQYMDLAAKLAEIEPRVAPGHGSVVKFREQMSELRELIRAEEERIAGSYASEYQIAKARESELAAAVTQLVGEAGTSNQAQVKMRELESSADTLRSLYNSYLQKFKEIDTVPTGTAPVQDARIITRAAPPLHKSSSKKALVVFAGSIMVGFCLGAGIPLTREWIADVFRSPDTVEKITDIPCVTLPAVNTAQERTASVLTIEDFVLDSPYSRFTETLRNIKALINAAHLARDAKVIGIVSSVAKEGKTTIAANLAALMIASSGSRTLLIDGDLHKRLLTARLAPDAREGLIEALANPSRLSAIVSKRERSGLDVLPCVLSGRIPNAAELLGSPEMDKLLVAARSTYDYIIIEIAPIMSVVDIKMVERFIDRFIFVIQWGQTKRHLVLEALTEAPIRDRIIGIILNNADPVALRRIEAYKGDRFRDYYEEG
jgi:succinoglycan biosynthesis transport protein ExoP